MKKDVELKIAENTYRADRDKATVNPGPANWEKPVDLGEAGGGFWDDYYGVLRDIGAIRETDRPQFVRLCKIQDRIAQVEKTLETVEHYPPGAKGGVQKHPALTVLSDLEKEHVKICAKFGMTPADRSRVSADATEKPKVARRKRG